jgi:hypothetical protein
MRVLKLWLCAMLVLAGSAYGQEATNTEATATEGAEAGAAEANSGAAAPAAEPAPLKGDVIHLKSGAILDGVQVLRRTPNSVIVEVLPGTNITIPRSQVVRIDYDAIDPRQQKKDRERMAAMAKQAIVAGQQLDPKMYERMGTDVAMPSLKYEDEDLIEILEELGKRAQVTIDASEGVQAMNPSNREWSLTASSPKTLLKILQDDLIEEFPNLRVDYPYSRVVISTRKEEPPESEAPNAEGEDDDGGDEDAEEDDEGDDDA